MNREHFDEAETILEEHADRSFIYMPIHSPVSGHVFELTINKSIPGKLLLESACGKGGVVLEEEINGFREAAEIIRELAYALEHTANVVEAMAEIEEERSPNYLEEAKRMMKKEKERKENG